MFEPPLHQPTPDPEKQEQDLFEALRGERRELYRCFQAFLQQRRIDQSDDAIDSSGPPLPGNPTNPLASHVHATMYEEAAGDKLPGRVTLLGSRAVSAGSISLVFGFPSLVSKDSSEAIMPLGVLGHPAGPCYLAPEKRNERFPSRVLVGLVADYDNDRKQLTTYALFTQRSYEIAIKRAQAIGASIDEVRRHDPTHAVSTTEPSSIISALYVTTMLSNGLPPPEDEDAKKWPILGLARVAVPETGACELGFLRVAVGEKRMRWVEHRHTIQLSLNNRLGILKTEYQGSEFHPVN